MTTTMCNSNPDENCFVSLWQDVYKLHWEYLDAEETPKKLESRKNLEVQLKKFLSMAPQQGKFLLSETNNVLKKSVMNLSEFSAYRASIGFDAISQYANNLLTKPWRKEYKTIKTYCGYYKHEVEANLLDAEKIFEAMGYTKLSNNTLVLKGPICWDQVANVSRDAMTAYVECQIMNEICAGLLKLKISSSWLDIFKFRETYIGNETNMVETMAATIAAYNNCNIHGHQIPPPPPPKSSIYHSLQQYNLSMPISTTVIPTPGCTFHPNQQPQQQQQQSNNIYTTRNGIQQQQQPATNTYNYANIAPPPPPPPHYHHHHQPQPQQQQHHHSSFHPQHPQLPHSKSLEHYADHHGTSSGTTAQSNYITNNRLSTSFDQPQIYDHQQRHHVYDAVDSGGGGGGGIGIYGSTNNYTQGQQQQIITSQNGQQQCQHISAYNVSGNRYPIPANISSQFNAPTIGSGNHYQVPGCNNDIYTMNPNWHQTNDGCYSSHNCTATTSIPSTMAYSKRQQQPQQYLDDCHYSNGVIPSTTASSAMIYDQPQLLHQSLTRNSIRDEHLLDIDDHHHHQHHNHHRLQQQTSHPTTALPVPPILNYGGSNLTDPHKQQQYQQQTDNRKSLGRQKPEPPRPPPSPPSNHQNQSNYADIIKSALPTTASTILSSANNIIGNSITASTNATATNSTHLHRDLINLNISVPLNNTSSSNMHEKLNGSSLHVGHHHNNKSLLLDKHQNYSNNSRNFKLLGDLQQQQQPTGNIIINGSDSRNSRASDFDSYDDSGEYSNADINQQRPALSNQSSSSSSTTTTTAVNSKNQDGVGSFETWHFVYQKLEKDGYSKDLGDRGDLSVQGLDLNPPGIGVINSADKKLARAQEHVNKNTILLQPTQIIQSVSSIGNNKSPEQQHRHENGRVLNHRDLSNGKQQNGGGDLYDQPTSSGGGVGLVIQSKSALKYNQTRKSENSNRNHVNNNTIISQQPSQQQSVSNSTGTLKKNNKKKSSRLSPIMPTPLPSSAVEWSCRFCTFLNPGSIRICTMCSKSNDFVDTPAPKATTTCV